MIRRLLAAATTVILAAVLFVFAWPQLLGLEWTLGPAQAVSFRGLAVVAAGVALALILIVAIVWVGARRLTGSFAILLVLFGALNLAVIATRGTGAESFATKDASDLTVLSWNTLGDAPGAEAIATLALTTDADILTLPETTQALGEQIAALMGAAGSPMAVLTTSFDEIATSLPTTLLISSDLGGYSIQTDVGNTTKLPTVVAAPDDGTGPTIVAVHSIAPVPGQMESWHTDQQWLASLCSTTNLIMAGDFNATIDHMSSLAIGDETALGECADAAASTGNAAVGTWPTNVASFLGAPIDHVMATDAWEVTGMRVIQSVDDFGSDHRPVVAQLSPS